MPSPASSQIQISTREGLTNATFEQLVLREGALHLKSSHWACRELVAVGDTVASARTPYVVVAVGRLEGALFHLKLEAGVLVTRLAAQDPARLAPAEEILRKAMPVLEPDRSAQEVQVSFWSCGAQCPVEASRNIAVTDWPAIKGNYAGAAREKLATLMDAGGSVSGGQLILWHGPPGTGKTHALRALAWEWRSWCDVHYIVDPETFLGDRSDYLMQLLMQQAFDIDDDVSLHHDQFAVQRSKRWRLLVLEDAGEMMAPEARMQTGQALSRLLNVVDGLLGQGLRTLVLITTNEELGRLHPAVSRPGRCLSVIEFPAFDRTAAVDWLRQHGLEEEPNAGEALAELYARLDGRTVHATTPAIGFAA